MSINFATYVLSDINSTVGEIIAALDENLIVGRQGKNKMYLVFVSSGPSDYKNNIFSRFQKTFQY